MTYIIFQQESGPSGQQPWPVLHQGDDLIYGRPDATAIIGFSPKEDQYEQAVSMTPASRITDPAELVGQYPIFTDAGNMFADGRKIVEAHEWDGTPDSIGHLREAMALQREPLEKAGAVAHMWTVVGTDMLGYPETIAAFRGKLDPDLNEDAWVVHVQSLNGQDAQYQARESRLAEIAAEDDEVDA